MGLSGYQKFGQGVDLEFFQVLQFPFEDDRIDDHPIAHNVDGPFVEYSGRDGVQYVLNTVELQGMARIGTPLKSCNNIVILGQYINNLSFSFVPPLESKQ